MEGSQTANLPPEGLGISSETIDEIIRERKEKSRAEKTKKEAERNQEPLLEQGTNRYTLEVPNNQSGTSTDPTQPVRQKKRGNIASYRIRKLRRDHPEIARRLDAGEFKSVAAAERASQGLEPNPPRKVPTPLDILRRAWVKASPQDRQTFLAEIQGGTA